MIGSKARYINIYKGISSSNNMAETIKVKCRYCKYEWDCKSKMITVSCPSCLKKIQIREIENELDK